MQWNMGMCRRRRGEEDECQYERGADIEPNI